MHDDLVRIQSAPLSIDEAVAAVGWRAGTEPGADGEAGALVVFSGAVRGSEDGAEIPGLDYEQYEGMAEAQMRALAAEARGRWPLRRVALLHRVGRVAVAEPSVLVVVSAGHRAEAFAAARFLIDELKARVPIWKSVPPPIR